MVIVKLQGGLGNQMFQYAAARALSNDNPIYIDLSFLKSNKTSTENFTARAFELQIFPNIRIKKGGVLISVLMNSKHKILRSFRNGLGSKLKMTYEEDLETVLNTKINANVILLDGYFQREQYINKIRPILLQDFTFPALNQSSLNWAIKISSTLNAIGIHVRRGDYLKPGYKTYHGLLPYTYYLEAIKLLNARLASPTYFIFSEDYQWCHSVFEPLGNSAIVVQTNDADWVDMCLMSKCKHHIIANSSFSWWAAWLNPFAHKLVVAPKNWYVDAGENRKTDSLIPENWIRI